MFGENCFFFYQQYKNETINNQIFSVLYNRLQNVKPASRASWSTYINIYNIFLIQAGLLKMEKGYPPQESTPPYPGPPMDYGSAMPQPGHPPVPPPAGYQGGLWHCFHFYDFKSFIFCDSTYKMFQCSLRYHKSQRSSFYRLCTSIVNVKIQPIFPLKSNLKKKKHTKVQCWRAVM